MTTICRYKHDYKGVLCGHCNSCCFIRSAMIGSTMNWDLWKGYEVQRFFQEKEAEKIWYEEQRFKATGKRYHNFITLNFKVGTDMIKILHILKNWDIAFLKGAKAVVEFYTEKGGHPHIHLISYANRRKENLLRELSNKFKMGQNYFHVVCRKDLYTKHIDYINGHKKDKKELLVSKDEEWRKKHSINALYTF